MEINTKNEEEYENTISKKPKYMENIWKTLMFLYSCIIQAITIALSLLDTPTLMVQDVYMFLMYLSASSFLLALMIYLFINRKETFEEAFKENSRSHKIAYSLSGEKVGLYLRFGLVLIGLFSLTYLSLSNARVITYKRECINYGIITSSSSQCLFFILQAIFILKYHSVIILRHKRVIQFGLYNIILVNILTWEISCLSKISYSGNLIVINHNCTVHALDTLHLYFLPAVAEYSVIGLAIMYEILKRVGRTSLIETLPEYSSSSFIGRIRHAIPGVVIGVLIVLLCIFFTIFIILGDSIYHANWIFYIHNCEEIFLYTFTIIILSIAFSKSRKLRFSFTFLQNNIDNNLLYVSCFLSIVFSTLISIYCLTFLTDYTRAIRGITALLEILQIIIQTIVIQDSFYRCSESSKQHHEKPGQNYFAILVGCNFGLWLLKSFQMKNGDIFFNKYQNVIKDNVLFSFFLYATMPLSILYRYHSSCCFAGAFSKIYQGEVDRFEGLLRAEGFESYQTYKSKKTYSQNQNQQNQQNQTLKRSRAQTQPTIPKMEIKKLNDGTPRLCLRRQTLKNLETAKLRILSSQLSQTLVRKKLSHSYIIESDSSTSTIQDNNFIYDFNLLAVKRHPALKRHSSNPLELSTINDFFYPNKIKVENTNNEENDVTTTYRSVAVLNCEDSEDQRKCEEIIHC